MKSHTLAAISFVFANAPRSLASTNLFQEPDIASPGLRGRSRAHVPDKYGESHQETVPTSPLHETRIIGGSEARAHHHNFAVSLHDSIGAFCGGALIARDVVLSAAHCGGWRYDVVVGRHDLAGDRGQEIPMKREVPHPQYKKSKTDNDFLLVFLKSPATLGRDVATVALNSDPSVPRVGDEVTSMGWGDTAISDRLTVLPDVLHEVQVNVVSNDECESASGSVDGRRDSYNGKITQNMLCATGPGRDSCQGDSGGPLVAGGVQVGVVSWGISCASDVFPGVYARVSRAYDWITEEVCAGSDYAAEAGFDCPGRSAPAPAPTPRLPSDDNKPAPLPSWPSGDAPPTPSPSSPSGGAAPASRPAWASNDSDFGRPPSEGGSNDELCATLNKWACKDEEKRCKWKSGECNSKPGSSDQPDVGSNPSTGSCADLKRRECKDSSNCQWKKGWKMCLDKPHRKRAHNLFD